MVMQLRCEKSPYMHVLYGDADEAWTISLHVLHGDADEAYHRELPEH